MLTRDDKNTFLFFFYASVAILGGGPSGPMAEDRGRPAPCNMVRAEKRIGTTTAERNELRITLDIVRKGDMLMVTRIDRLARSIGDLQDIVRR